MKTRNGIYFIMLIVILGLVSGCSEKIPLPVLDAQTAARLNTYLDRQALTPEEYVVSKFKDHDVVFLGEFHRIQHDPVLVQNLIPLLYAAGVKLVGIEFACAVDQPLIDSLLTAPQYDPKTANLIFWKMWPFWGFQEYIDILKVAWQFNQSLPSGSPPFRILGLNARMDWSYVWKPEDRDNPELKSKIFPDGDSDEVMARTIQREVIDKKEKALIYSGCNHAYTRFQQPSIDEKSGAVKSRSKSRMGNRIYDLIGDRCFNIYLHVPWPPTKGYDAPGIYPAGGVIDALFAQRPADQQRVGFDVKGSPFGEITEQTSLWSKTADPFRLDMYCDGWIFQKPLSKYEGCTVVENWFHEGNRREAISQIANPDPRVKNNDHTVESLLESLRDDTNFKRRFRHLW